MKRQTSEPEMQFLPVPLSPEGEKFVKVLKQFKQCYEGTCGNPDFASHERRLMSTNRTRCDISNISNAPKIKP